MERVVTLACVRKIQLGTAAISMIIYGTVTSRKQYAANYVTYLGIYHLNNTILLPSLFKGKFNLPYVRFYIYRQLCKGTWLIMRAGTYYYLQINMASNVTAPASQTIPLWFTKGYLLVVPSFLTKKASLVASYMYDSEKNKP